MTTWNPRANELFLAARELRSPSERGEFLDRSCGGDAGLRAEVEALLEAGDRAGDFLESPAPAVTVDQQPLAERPGAVVGSYKLLEQIGEGGFGVVFMAEQTQPVRRKVALKVLKPGMDTRQVVARFEAERQALAIMDHPNIARVFDGGATPTGRPYFVMELVRGVPITEFCDQNHLPSRKRLELFLSVCQAVQHAHQKGIIHRDLKPSNVLVTVHDTKPVVKVIDFGVAKALGQELTDKTLFTGFEQMIGTPLYMSPEQAGQSGLDIDTRSDIYSLGVLLYELLTGTTPFSKERFQKAAYDEIRRIIREEEPSRPSTKLSTADGLPTLAANRGTEPAKLTRLVRGELDWIVMKALEKDRNRRYETANGFAMDVQRYLADEAVQACPPSPGYRLKKFARRNKGGLAVAALVLFFLVLLGSGVGWALRDRAAREAEEARQQAERDAEAARQQAARRAKVAGQVEPLLGDVARLMKGLRWDEALIVARRAGAAVAGGEGDAETAERVQQVLRDLEMVSRLEEARLAERYVYAGRDTSINEGRPELYAAAFRDFGADVETLPADEAAARLRARPELTVPLAAALDDWARKVRKRAPDQTKRLWALAAVIDPDPWRVSVRQAAAAGDVDSLLKLAGAPEVARHPPHSQILLATQLRQFDRPEQALVLLERACEIQPDDFWIHFELAYIGRQVRPTRLEAAVRHGVAARALRPRSAATWINLGLALQDQKKPDEAFACFLKAVEVDPNHARARFQLATALYSRKRLDEAVAHFRVGLDIDPNHADGYINFGNVLRAQYTALALQPKSDAIAASKKRDEAIASYRKAIDLDPNNPFAYNNLAGLLGKRDETIACYKKAIEIDPAYEAPYENLRGILDLGGPDREQKGREAIAWFRGVAERNPTVAQPRIQLAHFLRQLGKHDEATAAGREAIKLVAKNADDGNNLGAFLCDQLKDYDGAIECFRTAVKLDPKHPQGLPNLVYTLTQKGWDSVNSPDPNRHDPKRALEAVQEAVKLDPQSSATWQYLGWVQYRLGDWRASIEVLERSCKLQQGGTGDYGQWIVMALAHARLAAQEGLPDKEQAHHKAAARRWFDLADKQIDQSLRARPADLMGRAVWDFRAEAREMIFTKDGKK